MISKIELKEIALILKSGLVGALVLSGLCISATKQDFLWPFYALACVTIEGNETNSFFIYEPLQP